MRNWAVREFGEVKVTFLISDLNWTYKKKSIPENTFFYVNHSYLLTIKNGDIPMYNHNFTLGQIIVATNRSDNIEI